MSCLITAIICTHNRADYLSRALDSLVCQSLPLDQYEILVVDNASTDGTASLVREYQAKYPHLGYLREDNLGLSIARNRGWQAARADYVAFLDDDAAACHEWLETLLEVFQRITPTPGFIGGKVTLDWETSRPAWLTDSMLSPLAYLDYGELGRYLQDEYLWGVNIAFPRALLESVGGFAENLGRKGECLISNEETLLQDKLCAMGYKGYYQPEAGVAHLVHHSRLRKSWYRRRYFWQGYSDVLSLISNDAPVEKNVFLSLLKEVWALLWRVKKGYKCLLPYKKFNGLRYQLQVAKSFGAVVAWYRLMYFPERYCNSGIVKER
ncbi:MAG: glycosyltransferase family 2 protein [Pedobacter sp.]